MKVAKHQEVATEREPESTVESVDSDAPSNQVDSSCALRTSLSEKLTDLESTKTGESLGLVPVKQGPG